MDSLPIPLSRVELYLAKIAGMDVTIPAEPESRLEKFLAFLAGDDVEMPTPWSLTEQWLCCIYYGTICNHPAVEGAFYVDNQKVDARYFAVASGVVGATLPPAPQNRKEQYWAVIAANGPIKGVLKSVTGSNLVLTDVVRGIEELQYVYGDTVQDGEPTPDSPVPISVVTGEQAVNVHGKNLVDTMAFVKGRVDNGAIGYAEGTSDIVLTDSTIEFTTTANYRGVASGLVPVLGSTTYAESHMASSAIYRFIDMYDESMVWISRVEGSTTTNTKVFNTDANCRYIRISFQLLSAGSVTVSDLQFELGSEVTAFQHYEGGVYTVDLGATELCKIGDYQDYIYKIGNDWYAHKAINSTTYQASEVALDSHNYTNVKYAQIPKRADSDAYGAYGQKQMLCTHATATGGSNTWDSSANVGHIRSGATTTSYWVGFPPGTTLETMQGALDGAELYYLLKTSTDTKITDATLISQLNAIDSATLPKPIAYITVGAASSSLPAPLKIEYYGRAD